MKARPKKIPDSVRASTWFADANSIDWQEQKDAIIAAVLNRGTWDAVRWIFDFYGSDAVREVVRHPRRGVWFAQSLRFWLCFFDMSLKEHTFQKALLKMAPSSGAEK